ncbi:MAG: alpha/beta hydrolase [Aquaticitalea sp.]
MKNLLVKIIGNYYNMISYLSKNQAADKALYLFTKPRQGRRLSEDQRAFLDTAYQEEFKYEKHAIMTYRWLGNKPTILLVHGWESNSFRWKTLVGELRKKGHNIIALDAPGHGNSGSRFFNAILYSEFINVVAKRFQPEIIIGHSVGGMATAFCQNKYQLQSVKKMVLLGAPSEFTDVLKRYTDMLGYNQRITKQLNLTIIERFGDKPENFSTAKYLEGITPIGLIIHDEHDTIIPYSDALLIKNSYKNSTLITTKGLGHSLNHETVSDHIYSFIEN